MTVEKEVKCVYASACTRQMKQKQRCPSQATVDETMDGIWTEEKSCHEDQADSDRRGQWILCCLVYSVPFDVWKLNLDEQREEPSLGIRKTGLCSVEAYQNVRGANGADFECFSMCCNEQPLPTDQQGGVEDGEG